MEIGKRDRTTGRQKRCGKDVEVVGSIVRGVDSTLANRGELLVPGVRMEFSKIRAPVATYHLRAGLELDRH